MRRGGQAPYVGVTIAHDWPETDQLRPPVLDSSSAEPALIVYDVWAQKLGWSSFAVAPTSVPPSAG